MRRSAGRKGLYGVVLLLVLGGCVGALALVDPPHGEPPGDWQADVALVLSGDVDYLRVKHAAHLFRSGAVTWLLVTGRGVGGDGAHSLASVARRRGVPAGRILSEVQSTSTWENMLFAAPVIRRHGFRRVALVTSASHLGRAERVARQVLPEVRWLPVAVPDAGPAWRVGRNRLKEWGKLTYYAARGWI